MNRNQKMNLRKTNNYFTHKDTKLAEMARRSLTKARAIIKITYSIPNRKKGSLALNPNPKQPKILCSCPTFFRKHKFYLKTDILPTIVDEGLIEGIPQLVAGKQITLQQGN